MARTIEDRPKLVAALGYLAVIALLFYRLFLGEVLSPAANLWLQVPFRSQLSRDVTPYLNGIQGDAWRACEPWHFYQHRSAQSGRFPLWNPHAFCGFPFHANAQSATLTPFHWLYFVLHPKWACGPVAALKLWVAAFATYCLARRLSMTPLAAFLAGAAWMLSAFNVRWLLWPLANATAWLPVVLLALDALVERPNWRRLGLAGLAVTVLQLSGHPECQFFVGALSGLYVLLRVLWLDVSVAQRIRRVLLGLTAHTFGLLGAAVSLVPFVEQMSRSVDWHESTHASQNYLPLEGLLGAIAPDHFGRPRAGRIYHDRLHINYNEAGLYIGLVPLALAVTALVRLAVQPRRSLHAPVGCAAAIFGLWFLLCGAVVLGLPGIAPVMRSFPLFSKADTLRLLFGVQFAAAMLAGAAWTWFSQLPDRIMGWTLIIVSSGIALTLAALLLMPELPGLYSHREGLRVLWTDPLTPSPLEHRSLRTVVSFAIAILNLLWGLMCVKSIRRRGDGPSRLTGIVLLALVLGDLGWVAYGFNPTVPPGIVFPEAPDGLRQIIGSSGDGRVIATDEILVPNLAMIYGLRDLRGYDFPIDTRWARLFRRLGWIGQKAGITLLPRNHVIPCVPPMLQSVLDKCAVRFLYTDMQQGALTVCHENGDGTEPMPSWRLVHYGPGDDAVYQNRTAYARAYFARHVTAADAETAWAAVLDIDHDLRMQSFVEDLAESMPAADATDSTGTVTFRHDGADEVILRTASATAGLLVLSDRFDPGWQVEIDGRPAKPLRTNYLFRGVMVPSGDHVVRWSYRPASFLWGSAISAVTLLILVAFLFPTRIRS